MVNKQLIVAGGALLVGAGIGFGTGYLVFKKKYQALAEQEIESVRQAYAKNAQPKPDISTLQKDMPEPKHVVAQPLHQEIVDDYTSQAEFEDSDAEVFRRTHGRVPTDQELVLMGQGESVESVVRLPFEHDDGNLVEGNIFDNPEPDPDEVGPGVDEEPEDSAVRPFVISAEAWFTNQTDYDQITLTYWADDDVLSDDTGKVITDVEEIVGATNLHRFGFKSDNPDIVYVRNHQRQADFEITKDERNYGEIVHGVDPDEKTGVPRRMRSNDD